jgi:carboxylesterase
MTMARRGFRRRWRFIVPAALVLLWLGGDFVHSRIVAHRLARWERSVERDADGVRAGCRAYDAGGGETALLLVHGFNDCPAVFDALAPRLVERGFTCRVMRLPGFAMPVGTYAGTSRSEWRRSLERELTALRQEHRRVGLVAHSLGGAIAVDYLLDRPESVEGVVLLAPLIEVSARRSPLLSPRAWYEIGRRALLFTRVVETPFPIDAVTPEAQAYDGREIFTPRPVFGEMYSLLDRIEGRAAEFRVPLLMVLGKRDEVIDVEAAERFFRTCSSPRRELLYLEQAGHMVPLDTGWESLPPALAVFFEESRPSPASPGGGEAARRGQSEPIPRAAAPAPSAGAVSTCVVRRSTSISSQAARTVAQSGSAQISAR